MSAEADACVGATLNLFSSMSSSLSAALSARSLPMADLRATHAFRFRPVVQSLSSAALPECATIIGDLCADTDVWKVATL